MSVACLAVALERWQALVRARRDGARVLAAWRAGLARGGWRTASVELAGDPRSHVAALIAAGTEILAAGGGPDRLEAYDRTTRRAIRATAVEARRGLAFLATVGSTAPFVGLFGTVVGIVNALDQIALEGSGGLGSVSAGIAEALVATALGIAVALPAVWLFNYLTQTIGRLLADMENASEELAIAALAARESHGHSVRN
jgi:biopolymer transport protein ExbB/TolQ